MECAPVSCVATEVQEALQRRYPQATVEAQPDGRFTVGDHDGSTAIYRIAESDSPQQAERVVRIVRSGLLRSLPEGVAAGVTEVVSTDSLGDIILALDTPRLPNVDVDAESIRQALVALARMHSVFAGFPARLTSGLGLLPLGQWLTHDRPGGDRTVDAAWGTFAARLPQSWAVVEPLLANPAPLVDALRDCQPTIVQGNVTPTALSIVDGTVTFHDWGLATRGPGALDLGAFIAALWPIRGLSLADCVETYRVERARLGRLPSEGERWDREAALGLLAGVLGHGWMLGEHREALEEWRVYIALARDAWLTRWPRL